MGKDKDWKDKLADRHQELVSKGKTDDEATDQIADEWTEGWEDE